jgi:SOS response associated peptidase (SRAP)
MCNDYGNRIPYSAYLEAFSRLKIRLFAPGGAPNLEPRDDIWPTDAAPIIRANKDGAELIQLRWGFPPGRPKGPPVINMRSEKRRFPRGRCLVPVSHFYEFTGKRSPKDKWRFTKVGEDWFCIAGLWRPVEGDAPAFTIAFHNCLLTCLEKLRRAGSNRCGVLFCEKAAREVGLVRWWRTDATSSAPNSVLPRISDGFSLLLLRRRTWTTVA